MTDVSEHDTEHTELEQALATLRNRWRLILVCLVATTLAALGFSLAQPKEYSASASLLFREPSYAQALYGATITTGSPDPTREAATNVKLVELAVVANHTAKRLGQGWTTAKVSEAVSVSEEGESDLVSITATDRTPSLARRVANTFAREFIRFRTVADRSTLRSAQRLAEAQFERLSAAEKPAARGQALSRAAERLGVLASLQTGDAELVQTADLPTSSAAPRTKRNTAIGVLLGLLIGIGMAFLLERLNRRLRSPEEAAATYDLPVLGTIPLSKALATGGDDQLPFMEEEAFRTLRASLRYFNVNRDMRSVLVTSHGAGEGKSTVSWNLARVAAKSSRVLLVEADLRNPMLARTHRLSSSPGLAEVLTRQASPDEGAQLVSSSAAANEGERTGSLSVIAAGTPAPNPAELLESQAMAELMAQLTAEYDFVVLDAPPTGVVSDAFRLLTEVTGVIVVSRLGMATRDSAIRLRDQLRQLKAPLLGVVANGISVRSRDRYGYGRGYYGRDVVEPPQAAVSAAADT